MYKNFKYENVCQQIIKKLKSDGGIINSGMFFNEITRNNPEIDTWVYKVSLDHLNEKGLIKPLPDTLEIKLTEKGWTWISFEFERLLNQNK